MKNRQHNDQKKKYKRTNNDLQNIHNKTKDRNKQRSTKHTHKTKDRDKQRSTKHTHKTKDRVTRTPPKTGGELRCSGRVSNSCSTSGTRRVILVTNSVLNHE